jgi:hypothetical protein
MFCFCFPYPAIGSAKVIIFSYSPKKVFSFFGRLASLSARPFIDDLTLVNRLTITSFVFAFQSLPAHCDWECKGKNCF